MPYSYNLSEEAENDIFEAYIWYERKRIGLGEEFLESLNNARQAIIQNPGTYNVRFKKKVRTFLVDRFPYLILYILERNEVNVISVFNTSRDPKIWRERINRP